MRFDILTIFPDIIYNYCSESILRRAQRAGVVEIGVHNFRDYSADKHKRVDDTPYGGGAGMILQAQPIYDCLHAIEALSPSARPACRRGREGARGRGRQKIKTKVVIMDPAGKKFDQRMAEKFSRLDRLVLIAGRYEGFDERIYKFVDEKISVGDYVLSGGELPALTIVEAVARLLPGVLGNPDSLLEETHQRIRNSKLVLSEVEGLKIKNLAVEYPQYTKPENFMGLEVPKVLLSGDHKKIEEWRRKRAK